jgi:hypothetical protein
MRHLEVVKEHVNIVCNIAGINIQVSTFRILQRLHDLEQLEDDKKKTLLDLIDTYIRDAKGRRAYAS